MLTKTLRRQDHNDSLVAADDRRPDLAHTGGAVAPGGVAVALAPAARALYLNKNAKAFGVWAC